MRRVIVIAMILAAAFVAPVAAQDRVEDRLMVNTLLGPGFVGDAAVFNMRATAGIKANDWLAFVGEWGTLSKPNNNVISGHHLNANVRFTATQPIAVNLRSYATLGAGSFRTAEGIVSTTDHSDFATNIGAGVMYDINDWLGVTFDYRRFFIDYPDRNSQGAATLSRTGVHGTNRYTFGLNIGLR